MNRIIKLTRWALAVSILAAAAVAGANAMPPIGAAVGELQQFQGAWKPISILNADGSATPLKELKQTRMVVVGDRFTIIGQGYTIAGRFAIDPARTPKAIDAFLDGKPGEKPVKVLGIYRIDGDVRRSCFAMPDEPRPQDFPKSPAGFVQFEWKRDTHPGK